MGAIQEPTPAMGLYRTEIRRESFYLTATGPTADREVSSDTRTTLRVPAAHVPHLLAALDQVTAHKGWQKWAGTQRTGGVTVTRDGQQLCIRTAEPVYTQDWDDQHGKDSSFMTEIAYADVDALRAQLTAHA